MKKIKLTLALFIGLSIISCSSDDDAPTEPQFINLFEFDNSTYSTAIGYFVSSESDSNEVGNISIILTNALVNTANADNVNFVTFSIEAAQLQNNDYSYSELDYEIIRNASIIDDVLSGGEILLSSQENGVIAIEGQLSIKSFEKGIIDLEFSFVREDNKTITGDFRGFLNDISDE